jgi:hypothetical protein
MWDDDSFDDGVNEDDILGKTVLPIDVSGGYHREVTVDGRGALHAFRVSFRYEVACKTPRDDSKEGEDSDVVPDLNLDMVAPVSLKPPQNEITLHAALDRLVKAVIDAPTSLTVVGLLERAASPPFHSSDVIHSLAPRPSPGASLARLTAPRVLTNAETLQGAERALRAVAADADDHLVSLLSRQIFQRAISEEKKGVPPLAITK